MSVELENAAFAATIFEKGAELASLRAVSGLEPASVTHEYLWNGDAAWWTGRAPLLFPIVGSLKDGAYTHQGKRWNMPSHGLARLNDFEVVRKDGVSADLRFLSSPKTRESYPFDFSLTVSWRLKADGISVVYTVRNTGTERMLSSIGSHPGFLVPFAGGTLEDYFVQFDQPEKNERWFLRDNLIEPGRTEPVFEDGRRIKLTKTIFDRGALVFKQPRSASFSLRNRLNSHSVTVLTEGAPYLGIWAKPGAPFVCIEPWHGIADSTDSSGILAEKEGILTLEPGRSFETGYRVIVS